MLCKSYNSATYWYSNHFNKIILVFNCFFLSKQKLSLNNSFFLFLPLAILIYPSCLLHCYVRDNSILISLLTLVVMFLILHHDVCWRFLENASYQIKTTLHSPSLLKNLKPLKCFLNFIKCMFNVSQSLMVYYFTFYSTWLLTFM